VIYLKASPDVLLERIARRGRPSEKSISRDYIVSLNRAYEGWMARARQELEVIEIDTDRIPLQGETPAFSDLVRDLKRRYPPQAELDLPTSE
jgi:deoxyguanosine kinase